MIHISWNLLNHVQQQILKNTYSENLPELTKRQNVTILLREWNMMQYQSPIIGILVSGQVQSN